ncbi:hypothetical protein JCM19231_2141 [Vibrio ishigakensis]|uniref:DUF3316 domain-containing protein n=1 Tax=Vibrio ishigakensis TaxID=1481914 RepID=A0A0B8NYH9_9VIBR|nr:hypothetical protein [Vibrio ishigakensis]GAM59006.1 hypothetical protein JCM19231_2141 [Vibrio ishigakensis]
MKKSLIALSLLAVTTSAFAAHTPSKEVQQLDQNMAQLETVTDAEMLVNIDTDPNFEQVEVSGIIVAEHHEMYISRKLAKKMDLEKVRKFFVYDMHDLDTLSVKIAERIDADQPDYFSVDLYKNYIGDSGVYHYVARVYEYK